MDSKIKTNHATSDSLTSTTSANDSSLYWGDPRLDDLCRQLPSFSSMLLCATDKAVFDYIRQLMQTTIPKSARLQGLSTTLLELSDLSSNAHQMTAVLDSIDLAIACCDSAESAQSAMQIFSESTSAFLLLVKGKVDDWSDKIDVCIDASSDGLSAQCRESGQIFTSIFSLPNTDIKASTEVRGQPKVALVSAEQELLATLNRSLGSHATVTEARSIFDTDRAQVILLMNKWNDTTTLSRIATLSQRADVIVGGPSSLRSDDRCAAYLCGARIVLPADAQLQEIAGAIARALDRTPPLSQSYLLLEEEYDYLRRTMKESMHWNTGQMAHCESSLVPIIANFVARSKLLSQKIGLYFFEIQDGKEVAENFTEADRFTNVRLLMRTRDLCFGIGRYFVIVSEQGIDRLKQMFFGKRLESVKVKGTPHAVSWPIDPLLSDLDESRKVMKFLFDSIEPNPRSL